MSKSDTWKANTLSKPCVNVEDISNDSVSMEVHEAKTTLIDLDAPAKSVKDLSLFPPFGYATKKIRSQGSGLSMSLSLDRLSYNANDSVQGTLRIQAPAKSKLKIGAIEVRIVGFEEIKNGKRPAAQRLFYSRRIFFQTPRSLPSEAVLSGTPDEDGMWFARPGDTVFPIDLPLSSIQDGVEIVKDSCGPLPSSFWKQSFGGVRYVLACTIHYKKGSKHEVPLGIYENLTVFEYLGQIMTPMWAPSSARSSTSSVLEISRGIFSKTKGTLRTTLSACSPQCENYGDSGIWTSGSTGFVKVEINNGTHKAIKALTLSLVCRLKTFEESGDCDASFKPLKFKRHAVAVQKFNLAAQRNSTCSDILGDPILTQKPTLLLIAPGETRSLMLELSVPADIRSVRFGSLVDISHVVELVIHVHGGHSLKLEAPVTILDRRSLMVSSPTFNSELPVKATEVIPETIDLETRSVSTEEIEDEDVQQPAVLEKEETLISAVEILDAGFTATGSTAGTSDVPAALAKNSTINSRRIDSLRYKEKTRIPSSNTMTETPQSLAMKHPAITKEAIASEIDDLFKTILA